MTTPLHNEPKGLFTSTAADYARHRPGIPPEAISLPADTMRNAARPVLLDLGSGTGQVPVTLLPAVPRIDRVDLLLERHSERGGLVEDAVFTVLLARRPGDKA